MSERGGEGEREREREGGGEKIKKDVFCQRKTPTNCVL